MRAFIQPRFLFRITTTRLTFPRVAQFLLLTISYAAIFFFKCYIYWSSGICWLVELLAFF